MIFTYEHDLNSPKMYMQTEKEISRSRL